ncbi:MAG: hypothetical protein JST67_11870 [Bacteroidetes bacterium]|nr:hypothetical protein [Bacteroidota bacterium]
MKKFIYILFTALAFWGCSNSLSVIAPYKESVSVYGLLDPSDTTHYIRIERVFLGEGNAYTMAQNQDSVYFQHGDLTVTLERWRNGTQISVDEPVSVYRSITLTDTVIQTPSGIFNQNERVYKTNHKLYADDSTCVYKLVVTNNKSGKQYTAQTGLIGAFQRIPNAGGAFNCIASGVDTNYAINFIPMNNGQVTCIYNSPANAGICGLSIRLNYTENGAPKTTDIGLGTFYPSVSSLQQGGYQMNFTYSGASLLANIAAVIPTNNSVVRNLQNIQFLLNAGGYDISLYNQVNASTSISQNKANYSNINGGVGVFSSRHQIGLRRLVTSMAKDTLAGSSQTCMLRFLNSANMLSPCH